MGRKKENIRRPIWYAIVYICLGICIIPLALHAEESLKVMQALTDDNVIKIYVRGGMEGEAAYQIANIPTDSPKIYGIEEDSQPMRTMVLIDNSLSIPKDSREKVLDAVKVILSGHGEKEEFRLATFDEEIRYLTGEYSTDYTALLNLVDSIQFENLETATSNVLYYLLKEMGEEAYSGYTRIVVISDGVDDKPLGEVDRSELNKLLETSSYPIYTIGSNTGKNSEQLSSLFSLSRLTGCEYCILEDTETEEIGNLLSLDKAIVVYEAVVPEKAGIGGVQSSKLTLPDGTVLSFDVTVPFYLVKEPELVDEKPKEPEVKEEEPETSSETTDLDTEDPKNSLMGYLIPAIIAILVLLCIVLITWFLKKRKSEKVIPDYPPNNDFPPKANSSYDDRTVLIPNEEHHGNTQIVTPGNLDDDLEKSYQLTLTDQKNQERSFRCTIQHEVLIGRKPENQIIISDDKTVSGTHCRILCKNGVFFIEDQGSQNKTFVNGSPEPIQLETLIVSGSTVKIGRAVYQISIKEL